MNEWLLLVLIAGFAPNSGMTMTSIKLPSQQACIDAGEEAVSMRPMLSKARYSCTEIKGSARNRPN